MKVRIGRENGLAKAKGEYVVIQDGDLEYNPDDLVKFEKDFEFKADGIIGSDFLTTIH